jgi:putative flippase GtrA
MVALPIAQVASLSVAYLTQKMLVFRTRGNYFREFIKFAAFYMGNFFIIAIILPVLVEIFHQNPIVAQFILSLGIIFVSYFWHSRVTFKQEGHL